MAIKGLEPRYNSIIEKDPKIVKIDLDNAEWASRKSAMPKSIKNDRTIRHVKG